MSLTAKILSLSGLSAALLLADDPLLQTRQTITTSAIDPLPSSSQATRSKIDILAWSITYDNNEINATDDALAIGRGYRVQANEFSYDRTKQQLLAQGDVSILKDKDTTILTKKATLNLPSDEMSFENLFLYNAESGLWSCADNATSLAAQYTFHDASFSSCNPRDPDWTIRYSQGFFDKDQQYVSMTHARLYAGTTPVLYLPYLAFPTNRTRRSGLLIPEIGYIPTEGLIYRQPYYFAPQEDWDFEIAPQIRTQRGYGLNGTFRMADSPESQLVIAGGIFKDNSSYQADAWAKDSYSTTSPTRHKDHYGYEIFYERRGIARAHGVEDGAMIDFRSLNDIDYLNLKSLDVVKNYSKLLVSRGNYFATSDQYYGGAYLRYFQDMTKPNNSDTLQTLPSLQGHRYTEGIGSLPLMYSLDYRYSHFYRDNGTTAHKNQVYAPLTWHGTFYDDYLHITASENLFGSLTVFGDEGGTAPKNYQAYGHYQNVAIFTNLVKPYDSFLHTMRWGIDYTKPSQFREKGVQTIPSDMNTSIAETQQHEALRAGLTQNFYESDGRLVLTHRLNQIIRYDEASTQRYGDTQNEIIFNLNKAWSIGSDTMYSHDRSLLSRQMTTVGYKTDPLDVSFSHIYKDEVGTIDTNYFTLRGSYALSDVYRLRADYEYDAANTIARRKGIGIAMKKSCWSYDLAYREENILGRPEISKILYLQLRLVPFGGLNQKYIIGG